MPKPSLFKCPVCSRVLFEDKTRYYCQRGHSFDIAREGYVNLLLPNHIGSGNPGDDKQMIQTRRDFLNQGYYQEFSDQVNRIVSQILLCRRSDQPIAILDAGCGEGYYTCRLKKHLESLPTAGPLDIYGVDVSKEAVRFASKRSREIHFAVASVYHLPVLENSMDCIISLFAPRDEESFRTVLRPKGTLIVAAPGENHLYSLRKALYDTPAPIGERGTVQDGFTLVDEINVAYNIHLKANQDLLNLLMMTPYSRHTNAEEIERLKTVKGFVTEVDIRIRVYQRNSSSP